MTTILGWDPHLDSKAWMAVKSLPFDDLCECCPLTARECLSFVTM